MLAVTRRPPPGQRWSADQWGDRPGDRRSDRRGHQSVPSAGFGLIVRVGSVASRPGGWRGPATTAFRTDAASAPGCWGEAHRRARRCARFEYDLQPTQVRFLTSVLESQPSAGTGDTAGARRAGESDPIMRVEAPALLGEVCGRRPQERAGSPRAGPLLHACGSPGVSVAWAPGLPLPTTAWRRESSARPAVSGPSSSWTLLLLVAEAPRIRLREQGQGMTQSNSLTFELGGVDELARLHCDIGNRRLRDPSTARRWCNAQCSPSGAEC